MKHTKVLFDEINNKTLIYAILNRNNEIFVLFAPITIVQKCYTYSLIYLMGCKLSFISLNLNILSKIYKRSHDDTKYVVSKIYAGDISYLKKKDLAMGFMFRREIASRVYDVITVYNYIYDCLELNNEMDIIYISNNKCNFPEMFFDRKVFLYGSKRRKKHDNFLNQSDGSLAYLFAAVLKKLINVRVSLTNKVNIDVQGVCHGHGHGVFKINEGKLLANINNRILEKYNVMSVSENTYFIKEGKTGKLNQLSIKELVCYLKNNFKFILYLINLKHISFFILSELLIHWIISTQMGILLKKTNCKFVYADYESSYSHCLLSQSRKIPGMVSFSLTNSLGYFPELRRYRCSEYFFVWGKYMESLLVKSGIDSEHIVTVGYTNESSNQLIQSQSVRGKYLKNYQGIIAVYDTTIGGIFCSTYDIIQMISSIINIAKNNNYYVLIKPKQKLKQSVHDAINIYNGHYSVIDEGKRGSLSCGFAADLVVGYGLSTIPNILATYGKKIVLFDPYDNLWDKYPYYDEKHRIISRSLKSLEENILYWINYHSDPKDFSFIDPYADHLGSDRVIAFIDSLIK